MTLDKIVSDDLAALAVDSRRPMRSVDDTLRALRDARSTAARDEGVAVSGDPALLVLARGFAARIARAAAGGTALACALIVFSALVAGRDGREPAHSWLLFPLIDRNAASIGALFATLVLKAYLIAAAIAGRWLEHRLRQPSSSGEPHTLADLRRWIDRADGWSIALPVAGAACVAALVATVSCAVGRSPWGLVWFHHDRYDALFNALLHDLAIALPLAIVAALALGRAARRDARWVGILAPRGVAWLGAAIALGTLCAALLYDAGPLTWDNRFTTVSTALRSGLTACGTLGVLLTAASLAVARHRRERRILAIRGEAALPADAPALLAAIAVLRARTARIAAGAMALAWALAVLALIHNPFGYTDRGGLVSSPDDAWWRWALEDHLTIFAIIATLVFAAYRLGGQLGDRALRRALRAEAASARDADARDARNTAIAAAIARRLSLHLDGWSAAVGFAGMISLALLFAILDLTAGVDLWVFFAHHGQRVETTLSETLHQAMIAIPSGLVVAGVLGHLCAREARTGYRPCWLTYLEHRAIIPLGLTLGLAASIVWMNLDFRVFDVSATAADQPSRLLRFALTSALTLAALLIAGGITVRRRHRELERLRPTAAR